MAFSSDTTDDTVTTLTLGSDTELRNVPQSSVCSGVNTATIILPLAVVYLLYGIYIVLFGLCVFWIPRWHKREGSAGGHFQFIINLLLFVLATLNLVFDSVEQNMYLNADISPTGSNIAMAILDAIVVYSFVLASFVADVLLIYRLFFIWGQRYQIIILPSVIMFADYVSAIIILALHTPEGMKDPIEKQRWANLMGAVCLLVITVANIFITSLIAGRVWYIQRQSRFIPKNHIQTWYNRVIVLILETGFLNVAFQLLCTVSFFVQLNIRFYPFLTQIAGIVPVFINVRVECGISTEDVVDTPESPQTC
ncbi:hypothetical protein K435DRAFT_858808 [Dendrothele bispora CBS 962.96]|uniref:G-protein coupled receptors family 1 profile domain-containing protein n=1 Tax=Dendrothele bispora (strain CBS 962.96) TaxID=1314807 RepID=A0A4S8M2U7_DENBC|nr:hypothetical protein K435DRAFT_858808 [Dendrothele bispora CBS 962.96]